MVVEIDKATHNVSDTLKWISRRPSLDVIKYYAYQVNNVHFSTRDRDNIRTTQNNGVSINTKIIQFSSTKDKNPIEGDMVYYGIIEEIWELDFVTFRLPVFMCQWVESNHGVREDELGFILINLNRIDHKNNLFIMAT